MNYASASLLLSLAELGPGFVECLAVDDDSFPGTGCGVRVERADPVAVLAFVDRAVAVDPAASGGLLVWWHLACFLVLLFECSYVLAEGVGGDEAEFAVLDGADLVGADQPVQDGFTDAEHSGGLTRPVERRDLQHPRRQLVNGMGRGPRAALIGPVMPQRPRTPLPRRVLCEF